MNTLRSKQVQDTLDMVMSSTLLRSILVEDGLVVEDVKFDRDETINDFVELCGYSEEDAINAYNNLKEYE